MNWGDAIGALRTFEGKVVQIGIGGVGEGDTVFSRAGAAEPAIGATRVFGCLQSAPNPRDRGKFILEAGGGQVTIAVIEIAPAQFKSADWLEDLLLIEIGSVTYAVQEAT